MSLVVVFRSPKEDQLIFQLFEAHEPKEREGEKVSV